MLPVAAIAAVYAGHLICWRSIPLARRSRTNNEEATATNMRANMIACTGSLALGRPSMPSGLEIDPRLKITPGVNACQIAHIDVRSRVSHTNHLQLLPGNRPSGKSTSESTRQPMNRTHTQHVTQASALPAGSVPGCTDRKSVV